VIESIRDFLGDVSGYRPLYLASLTELEDARETIERLTLELAEAKEKIRQLELLVPRPAPPELTYIVERDSAWIQWAIDDMGLGIKRLQLDVKYRLTSQGNWLNILAWDFTDQIPTLKEIFDCENFAILLKAFSDLYFHVNQLGIVLDYKSAHSYNLAVWPDGNKGVVEPKSDGIYVWTKRIELFYPLEGAYVLL
jgi:hypothetical protein